MYKLILVVNPGTQSTKIAVFKNREKIFLINLKHKQEDLAQFKRIADQFEYRKNMITAEITKAGIEMKHIDIIIQKEYIIVIRYKFKNV